MTRKTEFQARLDRVGADDEEPRGESLLSQLSRELWEEFGGKILLSLAAAIGLATVAVVVLGMTPLAAVLSGAGLGTGILLASIQELWM